MVNKCDLQRKKEKKDTSSLIYIDTENLIDSNNTTIGS